MNLANILDVLSAEDVTLWSPVLIERNDAQPEDAIPTALQPAYQDDCISSANLLEEGQPSGSSSCPWIIEVNHTYCFCNL